MDKLTDTETAELAKRLGCSPDDITVVFHPSGGALVLYGEDRVVFNSKEELLAA